MAQRTEKEETEFKVVPESLSLCINNCGGIRNPATNNMCQKCFTTFTATSKCRRSTLFKSSGRSVELFQASQVKDRTASAEKEIDVVLVKRVVNRCSGCRRKVGLTRFRCRCGDLFCDEHRYSDRHDWQGLWCTAADGFPESEEGSFVRLEI